MTSTATAASAVQKGDVVEAPKNNRLYKVTTTQVIPGSGKVRLWGQGMWQKWSVVGVTRIGTFLPDELLEVED